MNLAIKVSGQVLSSVLTPALSPEIPAVSAFLTFEV